jgi:hypothetical protein
VDYGGDPRYIPDLTYAQFKGFHETFYHPSNSWIFFYGDDDPEERLRRMAGYLEPFERLAVESAVPLLPLFAAPHRIETTYDPGQGSESQKGMLTVNWLLSDPLDPQTTLAMTMLAHILIGTPASPLRKALIDSGLGEDLAGGGLDSDLRQMYFSTGLKGIGYDGAGLAARYPQVENLIFETLTRLSNEGIDVDTISATVNTVEFRLRENNTGSFPRGLALMLRTLGVWLYDGDPLAALAFEAPLQAIKRRLADGERLFEGLIRRHLLDNPHHTVLMLNPQPGLQEHQEVEEAEKLAGIREGLTEAELRAILENTRQLKLRQETPDTPQALRTIPSLKLEDLEKQNKLIPIEILHQDGTQILFHDLFTNGIVYLDIGFNLHTLPPEYLPYVSLFNRALLEIGTEKEDFVRLSQRIGRSTGGIRPAVFTSAVPGSEQAAAWMFLRGKATLERGGDLLEILGDILRTVRLDNQERFLQMVMEEKADVEAGLVYGGHRMVNTRLRSFFHEANWADEQMGGVTYLYFLRELVDKVEGDWGTVLADLELLKRTLIDRNQMVANLTLDAKGRGLFQPLLAEFIAGLPAGSVAAGTAPAVPAATVSWERRPPSLGAAQGLTIPSQVNYVGKGGNLYSLGYQPDGSFLAINNYLDSTWLWEKVRVQGGAYGCFPVFDHRSGVFTFLSYRDPNLLQTLDVYDQAGRFLRQLDSNRLTESELTKSIIGAIGDMDAYQLPDAKGFTSLGRYLIGETDEIRQRRRDELLSTTLADFHAFGEVLERLPSSSNVVVLGAEVDMLAANQAQAGWLEIEKVL